MWLQRGSHHVVGFLVRTTCFSEQIMSGGGKKSSRCSLLRHKWAGEGRIMKPDLDSMVQPVCLTERNSQEQSV